LSDLDSRMAAAHKAAALRNPAKREQHELAAAILRGDPEPATPPSYHEIVEDLTRLGMLDALRMFWLAHAHQDEGPPGAHAYTIAFSSMRKLATAALDGHKRTSVWIPQPVKCGAPMEFIEIKHSPKGERSFTKSEYRR